MIIGKAVSVTVYDKYKKSVQCIGRIYASSDSDNGIRVYVRDFLTGELYKASLENCRILNEENNAVFFIESHENQWGRVTDCRLVKFYIKKDSLHREDGPAIETINLPDVIVGGGKCAPRHHWNYSRFKESYYLNGIRIKKEDYFDVTTEDGKEKIIFNLDQFFN